MTTPLSDMFDEATTRCEFGFWIERNPPGEADEDQIELEVDDAEFRAIVAVITDTEGRSLYLEAGVDDETGPFVSVKGLDLQAEPVNLQTFVTDASVLINLDDVTSVH